MSEVLIDDLNLNRIANSIRRKNGLVRTYKPREMAPAIRAFRDFIPSPHEYNVVINQTPNQRITVRKFLETNRNNHTGTFTVAEPFYTLDISVEPEFGYQAGQLNCNSPVVLDRDMIIEATPAVYDPENTGITTVYVNGSVHVNAPWDIYSIQLYSDDDCRQTIGAQLLSGKVQIVFVDTGFRPMFSIGGEGFLGASNDVSSGNNGTVMYYVTEVYLPILDTSDWNSMRHFARSCYNLRKIYNFETWDLSNVTDFREGFLFCNNLRSVNLSNQTMSSLVNASSMFQGCSVLRTLDLSGWNTLNLMYVSGMFTDCGALENLDISNWDTSSLTQNLNLPSNLHYLIMNKEEVKFINNGKCNKPNNYIKYLVPSDMVEEYKAHPDWSAKADNIFSVDDFNIVRYDGQVFVTPNE